MCFAVHWRAYVICALIEKNSCSVTSGLWEVVSAESIGWRYRWAFINRPLHFRCDLDSSKSFKRLISQITVTWCRWRMRRKTEKKPPTIFSLVVILSTHYLLGFGCLFLGAGSFSNILTKYPFIILAIYIPALMTEQIEQLLKQNISI